MAITLIVNPGSSSKKYALFAADKLLLSAHLEQTNNGLLLCTSFDSARQQCDTGAVTALTDGLSYFLTLAKQLKQISSEAEIEVVAVRIVAPGSFFQTHRIIDTTYRTHLRAASALAPLHIPPTEKEINQLVKILPQAKLIGISDSAFHSSHHLVAGNYSLDPVEAKQLDLYRFGYHGLSAQSVVKKAPLIFGSVPSRLIVCHIGSGVSVMALKDGKSFDHSMGYAPGSGLLMSSRGGDVDAGALLTLMQARNLRPLDAQIYLQTKTGLIGLAGESDLRQLLERRNHQDKVAAHAVDSFIYHIKKAIGAMMAALGGVDALVFTATAAERSPVLRSLIIDSLVGLSLSLAPDKNEAVLGRDGLISHDSASIPIAVIRNDEAAMMWHLAREIVAFQLPKQE